MGDGPLGTCSRTCGILADFRAPGHLRAATGKPFPRNLRHFDDSRHAPWISVHESSQHQWMASDLCFALTIPSICRSRLGSFKIDKDVQHIQKTFSGSGTHINRLFSSLQTGSFGRQRLHDFRCRLVGWPEISSSTKTLDGAGRSFLDRIPVRFERLPSLLSRGRAYMRRVKG